MRPEPVRNTLRDASFSKAPRRCPATRRRFSPADAACRRGKKAAGLRRLLGFRKGRECLLQPLGATGASLAVRARSAVAVVTVIAAAAAAVAVEAIAPLATSFAAAEAMLHVGQ